MQDEEVKIYLLGIDSYAPPRLVGSLPSHSTIFDVRAPDAPAHWGYERWKFYSYLYSRGHGYTHAPQLGDEVLHPKAVAQAEDASLCALNGELIVLLDSFCPSERLARASGRVVAVHGGLSAAIMRIR